MNNEILQETIERKFKGNQTLENENTQRKK